MRAAACRCAFAAVFLAMVPIVARAADCDQVARSFAARLNISVGAMDEGGALVMLREAAQGGLRECPDLEPQGYTAARIAELGYAPGARRSAVPTADAQALAQEAAQRHPKSQRIVTLLARLDGSVDMARRALALDPAYAPARVQLALALAATGTRDEALALLSQGRDADRIASEWNARAKIRMMAGDIPAAIKDARAARVAVKREAELMPGTDTIRDTQEILGLALLAQGRAQDAAVHLELASAVGSLKAQAALDDLRKARGGKVK